MSLEEIEFKGMKFKVEVKEWVERNFTRGHLLALSHPRYDVGLSSISRLKPLELYRMHDGGSRGL